MNYCSSCGEFIGLVESTEKIENYRLFIETNVDYYLDKWRNRSDSGSVKGWNWAAFWFSLTWLAYRKMFKHIIIIIAISLLIDVLFFQSENYPLINFLYFLGVSLYYGNKGNEFYYKHTKSKIEKIQTTHNDSQNQKIAISKAGGVSLGAVVSFIALFFIVHSIFFAVLFEIFGYSTTYVNW